MKTRRNSRTSLLGLGLLAIVWAAGELRAQPPVGPGARPIDRVTENVPISIGRRYADYYDGYRRGIYTLADRIRAQGDFLESYGRFLVSKAEADLIQTEVDRREIENDLKRVWAHYERARIRWEGKEAAKDRLLQRKINDQGRKRRRLEELTIPPSLAAAGISINDLLEDLRQASPGELATVTDPIELSPRHLADVRILIGAGHSATRLRFDESGGPDYLFEPPALFEEDAFADALRRYEAARRQAVSAINAGEKPSRETMDVLDESLMKLGTSLDKWADSKKPWKSNVDRNYVAYSEASDFMVEQSRQIGWLTLGRSMPPSMRAETLQDLVSYLNTNGYRFGAADPGGENTYKALFEGLLKIRAQLK